MTKNTLIKYVYLTNIMLRSIIKLGKMNMCIAHSQIHSKNHEVMQSWPNKE